MRHLIRTHVPQHKVQLTSRHRARSDASRANTQVVRASRNLPLILMKGEYERILRRRLAVVGGSPDDGALQEMLSSFRCAACCLSRRRWPCCPPLTTAGAVDGRHRLRESQALTSISSAKAPWTLQFPRSLCHRMHYVSPCRGVVSTSHALSTMFAAVHIAIASHNLP